MKVFCKTLVLGNACLMALSAGLSSLIPASANTTMTMAVGGSAKCTSIVRPKKSGLTHVMKPIKTPKGFYVLKSSDNKPIIFDRNGNIPADEKEYTEKVSHSGTKVNPKVVASQIFDTTVITGNTLNPDKAVKFILYDYSIDESGGVVQVFLNGKSLGIAVINLLWHSSSNV